MFNKSNLNSLKKLLVFFLIIIKNACQQNKYTLYLFYYWGLIKYTFYICCKFNIK